MVCASGTLRSEPIEPSELPRAARLILLLVYQSLILLRVHVTFCDRALM
jgi:hypothetical protein